MRVDTSDVRGCLCLQARRAARHITQIYDQALRASGLRITQFQFLAAIGETEPVTQQALAGIMGMDRTTLTRNLALLRRDGFIHIEAGREDRREHLHSLTSAGRKALMKALPMWRSAQEQMAEQLSANGKTPGGKDAAFHLPGALGTQAGKSL